MQEANAGVQKLPGPDPGPALSGHVAGGQRVACWECAVAAHGFAMDCTSTSLAASALVTGFMHWEVSSLLHLAIVFLSSLGSKDEHRVHKKYSSRLHS